MPEWEIPERENLKTTGFLSDKSVNGVSVQSNPLTNTFKVCFDVSGFKADDIKVNMNNKTLFVSAERYEVQKDKVMSKKFNRQIEIPKFVDRNTLKFYSQTKWTTGDSSGFKYT